MRSNREGKYFHCWFSHQWSPTATIPLYKTCNAENRKSEVLASHFMWLITERQVTCVEYSNKTKYLYRKLYFFFKYKINFCQVLCNQCKIVTFKFIQTCNYAIQYEISMLPSQNYPWRNNIRIGHIMIIYYYYCFAFLLGLKSEWERVNNGREIKRM